MKMLVCEAIAAGHEINVKDARRIVKNLCADVLEIPFEVRAKAYKAGIFRKDILRGYNPNGAASSVRHCMWILGNVRRQKHLRRAFNSGRLAKSLREVHDPMYND